MFCKDTLNFSRCPKDEEFGVYTDNGSHSLFNRIGDRLKCNLHQKVQQMGTAVVSESLESGGVVHTYPIDDEVYVKIMPSGKLVRIVAVREELHQAGKL